jgi:hypothetical protein
MESRSLSSSSIKIKPLGPETNIKLSKCRSFNSFQNKLPFACKLVYSQGKLLHSNFEILPKWFRRKKVTFKLEKTASTDEDKQNLTDLGEFFNKSTRLNLDEPRDQNDLQNVCDIIGSSTPKYQGVDKVLVKRRNCKPKRIFMRSRRNFSGFDFFENEGEIIFFPNEETKILHHPKQDDDVDTDEEQMNQGVYRSLLDFTKGLYEIKRNSEMMKGHKCQSSSRNQLLLTREYKSVNEYNSNISAKDKETTQRKFAFNILETDVMKKN